MSKADRGPEGASAATADAARVLMRAAERVEHVVVLMLENRSFDHMLGFLPGVDGVVDGHGTVKAELYNRADPTDPKSDRYPVAQSTYFAIPKEDHPGEYGGPSHSFPAATEQLYNNKNGPDVPAGSAPATNSGFVRSYISELTYSAHVKQRKPEHVAVAMNAFTPAQLPVINTLAQQFCVCDQWYSEVPGPTEPNRLFMHAATSEGMTHNVWTRAIHSRTIQQNLADQGHDWAFYYFDLSDSNQFPALKEDIDRVKTFDHFYTDVNDPNALPTYSFLCPRYSDTASAFANSQHAPYDVRYGEHLIADVYEAVRNSPVWEKTLLIVVYDEHGGFYDHVFPPDKDIANPDGLTSPTADDRAMAKKSKRYSYLLEPDYVFAFDRLGCRVPALLISPWIAKGAVDSTRYQHTSVAATLKKLFGLPSFLTKRDAQANTFEQQLAVLDKPRADAPKKLKRPPLPGQAGAGDDGAAAPVPGDAPLGKLPRDVFKSLAHLDGHPDSGKEPPVPKTQKEASAYIAERYAAHNAYHRRRRSAGRFEIFRDRAGKVRWRLRDGSGEIVATSGEGWDDKADAEREIRALRQLAAHARQVEV